MNRRNRVGWRATVALAAVSATLAVAAPAEAHPIVTLRCEAGAGFFHCSASIAGDVPPIRIRWYINGHRAREFDNQRHASGAGCPVGSSLGVEVRVTDASGVPGTDSRAVFCREEFQ